jgi:hypothetical protein
MSKPKSKSTSEIIHPAGVTVGMPDKEYFAIKALSASFLKKFRVSPLRAQTDDFDGSAATDLGSFIHASLLSPSELSNFACLPTTGEGSKKAREAWKLENPEGVLLSPSQMDNGHSVIEKLKKHTDFIGVSNHPEVLKEVVLQCKHPKFGFPMKAKLDLFIPCTTIGDIKTFGSEMTKRVLYYRIIESGYDLQLAHYRRMVQMIYNRTPDTMELYFAETETAGHDVCTVSIDDGWLAMAEMKLDGLYEQYADCLESGVWPGVNYGKKLTLSLGEKF